MASKRPKSVTCYICGRGYGTTSIGIHLKQCKALFIAQEALKPKRERRSVPQAPSSAELSEQELLNVRPGKTQDVDWDDYNDKAFETFNTEALVPCENCGRTFLPESLPRHHNFCTPDKPARKVGESQRAGGESKDEVARPSPSFKIRPKSSGASLRRPSGGASAALKPLDKTFETRTFDAPDGGGAALVATVTTSSDAKPSLNLKGSVAGASAEEKQRDNAVAPQQRSTDPEPPAETLLRAVVGDVLARGMSKQEIIAFIQQL